MRTWRYENLIVGAARGRFFNSFAEQVNYSTDRLTGAANMFDLLPESAVPCDVQVSKDLSDARNAARSIFQKLPQSPERDSILGALGRIGKASLKQKVRHRAQRIVDALGDRLRELLMVTDEAVNCRNYYVHGGEPRFNYDQHIDTRVLFTDTLEFVFAASDLIDAGWNINSWMAIPTAGSHPFGRFWIDYGTRLQQLKDVLQTTNRTG
jgi:ApeA N-terminal domain 1